VTSTGREVTDENVWVRERLRELKSLEAILERLASVEAAHEAAIAGAGAARGQLADRRYLLRDIGTLSDWRWPGNRGESTFARCGDSSPTAEGKGEGRARLESVVGMLGQTTLQGAAVGFEIWSQLAKTRWRRVEMVRDDHRRVGMCKWRATGQQMEHCGRQGILISAAVEVAVHELLRSGVTDCSDGHVGGGKTTDVIKSASYAEVSQ
jgi:hypothetical protein